MTHSETNKQIIFKLKVILDYIHTVQASLYDLEEYIRKSLEEEKEKYEN